MNTSIWIIDAFTSVPFKGNPAAVCLLDNFPNDATMQQIAMEMNLSETAFLVNTAPLQYDLRWFTPTVEVNLCGHATLAATHMLKETGQLQAGDRVTYNTQSGELKARVKETAIELDFPVLEGKVISPHPALDALGVEMIACEKNRDNYLVEVRDYKTLLACTPDFKALAQLDMQGVIVTTAKDVAGYDFASRYFGPGAGIDEDPVTGSAHCFLAPYWAKKLGKTTFHALQASTREGILDASLAHDRVLISGHAVTTLKSELQLPLSRNQEKAA
jgi:PhzF family phenazine biosynthesis protein